MSPSKQQIIDNAVEIVRKEGVPALNARALAKKLNCSTQPIYTAFKNMDELKQNVVLAAQEIERQKVNLYLTKQDIPKYKAYGMGFVRFANDEKELFKLLYMSSGVETNCKQDVNYNDVIKTMCNLYGFSKKQATLFHNQMSVFSYGLAVMQVMGNNMSDKEVAQNFKIMFDALFKLYSNKNNKDYK